MKYKEGDIVRIISNQHGHQFNIGEKVRIKKVCDIDYKAECLDGHDYWYVQENEIELVKEAPKIKELQQRIDKAIELNKQIKSFVYNEMVDRCVPGSTELYELVNDELEILEGGNNE